MDDVREIEFTVLSEPVPEGSMKGIPYRRGKRLGCNLVHTNDKFLKKYRKDVANVADEYHNMFYSDNKDIAYEICVVFYLPRGKTVKRRFPTARSGGDLDKLLRAVMDALTENMEKYKIKGLFPDDSQVIRIKATKYYIDEEHPVPQTTIRVRKVLLSKTVDNERDTLCFDDDI